MFPFLCLNNSLLRLICLSLSLLLWWGSEERVLASSVESVLKMAYDYDVGKCTGNFQKGFAEKVIPRQNLIIEDVFITPERETGKEDVRKWVGVFELKNPISWGDPWPGSNNIEMIDIRTSLQDIQTLWSLFQGRQIKGITVPPFAESMVIEAIKELFPRGADKGILKKLNNCGEEEREKIFKILRPCDVCPMGTIILRADMAGNGNIKGKESLNP